MVHKGGDDVLGLSKWDSNVVFIHLPKLFIGMSVFLPNSLATHLSDVPVRCIVVWMWEDSGGDYSNYLGVWKMPGAREWVKEK